MANKHENKHTCKCDDKCACQHETQECCCENHGSKESEYLELAQRIKAEFENYKRRNAEVASQSFNNGVASAVTKLLPCIDAFNQAKSNIADEKTVQGLDMVLSSMLNAFTELGVSKIEAVGNPFNPNFHNAVLTGSESEIDDDIVLDEYQQGFIMGDRVIRHSVVKINKK